MKDRESRESSRRFGGVPALASLLGALGTAPAAGRQPPPAPDPAAPLVQTTVAAAPNPDGTFRVTYQIPLPARTLLAARPMLRVLNAKGELAGLLGLRVTQRGPVLWAGHGDFRLPKNEPGEFQVRVEVVYERPDGSRGLVAVGKPLSRPGRR